MEYMSDLFGNGIVQSVVAAIVFAVIVWLYQRMHFWWDERKIFNFINESSETFRSTEAIAANTHLETSRIQYVAAKSKRIRRNSKEKESWCLAERD